MKERLSEIRQKFRNNSKHKKNHSNQTTPEKYYSDDKFGKLSSYIRQKPLGKIEFENAVVSMNEKIQEKKLPYRLKKDFEGMKFLITTNQKLNEKFAKKVRRMRKFKSNQVNGEIAYDRIDREIKNSAGKLKRTQFLNREIT